VFHTLTCKFIIVVMHILLFPFQMAGGEPDSVAVCATDGDTTTNAKKDDARSRTRTKCKPPRSIYLDYSDLMAAVSVPPGASAPGDNLVKAAETQVAALKRQVSWSELAHEYKKKKNLAWPY
jgi:hypothetical protein